MNFKDLFSGHAEDYAKFRPHYPKELFEYLSSISLRHDRVWDCGTGNGQAAVELAAFFREVIATDPSEKQLSSAQPHSGVIYRQASAEVSDLESASVDLVTVAQAFHWFKHAEFYEELKRVARPDAHLAIWSYNLCKVTPEVEKLMLHLYDDVLGDQYWEPERKHVEKDYRSIPNPFDELPARAFEMKADWSLDHLVGYMGTWSALQKYVRQNGSNPLEALYEPFKTAWEMRKRARFAGPCQCGCSVCSITEIVQ